jgi:death-on-curing protein
VKLKYLSLEEILRLHFQVIEDYGGSHGVRDNNRLKSVINAPNQEAFGKEQYHSTYEKSAVYLRNIIGDRPFIDGNKRSAITVCAIFLRRNDIDLTAIPKELEDFTVRVSTERLSISDISEWLESNATLKA